MQVCSSNLKHCARRIQVRTEEHCLVKEVLDRTLVYSEFYLRCFTLQVLLAWIPIAVLEELSIKPAQVQEVAEDWRRPETRETELDVLQRLGNKGARKRRERGRVRYAAQTASERQHIKKFSPKTDIHSN